MNRIGIIGSLLLMMLFAVSCNHKELCYDHDPHSERVEYKLELLFDCEWEKTWENRLNKR